MQRGKLISIEGIEGAGKSTALQFIKEYLAHSKIEVILTREPGGTPLAEEIRHFILHPTQEEILSPETELLLFFAARSEHVKKKIIPALEAGKWVVTDRFIDASYAYQGGGREIALPHIEALDQWIVGDHYPDLTLLFDVDPEIGLTRTALRGEIQDRIEQEKIDFFIRVRKIYLKRAKENSKRIKIIDANETLQEVQNKMKKILDDWMKS